MKNLPSQRTLSEKMMYTLRHRLRLPVTALMIGCNFAWSLQSHGEVLIKTNSGSNTFLSPSSVLPNAGYVQGDDPTGNDILLFRNEISAASTFRLSGVANSTLAIQGLRVFNPSGAITIQNNTSQNQTLSIGSAGIDLSQATQNLILNNNTGGVMNVVLQNAQAATWSVATGRTLQVTSNISGTNTGLTINPGVNGLGGTVNLGGANTFTGATTVNNSALILDYTTAANRIHSGSALNLNRGVVTVQGSATHTQAVAGLNLGAGLNQILRGGTTASINLGAINRVNPNALLNVGAAGFVTTSQANAAGGILGGWAVVGNNDWAVANGSSAISALGTYVDRGTTWTNPGLTDNVRITGTSSGIGATSFNSLKFNGNFTLTQTAGTIMNIVSGGILKNDNTTSTLTGGSLTAGGPANGAADSLYIWQSQNKMTIASAVVNNGADVVNVIKAGAGELELNSATSNYTGVTTVANGRLTIAGSPNAINRAGNIELYGNSGADNTGSLQWNTATATLTGNITGASGNDSNRHALRKLVSTSVLTLTPSVANTYSGSTLIDAGTLQAGNTKAFSPNSRVQFANVANAILNLGGFNNTVRGLSGGGTSGGNVVLGSATLTMASLPNDALSYAGVISGAGGLIKEGDGTQTFTANQSFSGPLVVDQGILSTAALATTNVTVQGGGVLQPGNLASATVITVNGNGMLQMKAGGSLAASPSVSLNGVGSTLQLSSGVAQTFSSFSSAAGSRLLMGAGSASSTLTFAEVGSGTTQINGVIAMSGNQGTGKGNVVKGGDTTWVLSGGNAYNGSTEVTGGKLSISPSAVVEVLPDGTTLTLADRLGVEVLLNGKNETIGALQGGGAAGGNVLLGAGTLTTGGNGESSSYAGIISGTGSLIKTGGGTMALSGANSFTGGLTLQGGTVSLNKVGGGTLASTLPVTLQGMNARLQVNTNQTVGSLNAGPNTTIEIPAGVTLTSSQGVETKVSIQVDGDTDTRILRIKNTADGSKLRAGMSVSGVGIPEGTYITQVLNEDQVLINFSITGTDFTNRVLEFGSVGVLDGTLEGGGNWTKTGEGRVVIAGKNTLSGNITLDQGALQIGGISSGGRNWFQDIIDNNASVIFSGTQATTLNFTSNVVAYSPYERVGSIAGGVSPTGPGAATTINLLGVATNGGATNTTLAVGGNNASSTFKGTIRGEAGSMLIKEGNGTLTWQSDKVDQMRGTIRVESGGLTVSGAAGLHVGTRLSLSNKPGTVLTLETDASQTVTSLVGGGRGAVTSFSNGVLGALGGNYLGETGGEVRFVDKVPGDGVLPTLTVESTVLNAVFRYGGSITGEGNLTKRGQNTLELFGDNTYTGETTIQTGSADNTTSTLRLGAYGTSSGVGTLANGGYGSLPTTTRLQMFSSSINRSVVFDLNGKSQTVSSLHADGVSGGRTVLLRSGELTIDTQGTDTSGNFNGTFGDFGTINVVGTRNSQSGTDGWTLSGDSNGTQSGFFNIQGGKVTVNRVGGSLGDTVHMSMTGGELLLRESEIIGSLAGTGSVSISAGRSLTLTSAPSGGQANRPWNGIISGSGGLVLAAGGSIRLTTPQEYNGGTTLNSGSALYLDYGSVSKNLLPGTLRLNGGSIFLSGTAGQSIANTQIGNGTTVISTQVGASASMLRLSTITRDLAASPSGEDPGSGGGVLQIRGPSVSTGTLAGTSGILGGFATYHAVDGNGNPVVSWAKPNGINAPITGYNSYTSAYGDKLHTDVTGANVSGLPIQGYIGSLRFNTAAPVELFIGGPDGSMETIIQSGGILVTPSVGINNVSITGYEVGAPLAGGIGGDFRVNQELIIHQHNTRGTLTINANIVDRGGDTRLTKTGQGTLILTQPNSYNGQTSIMGGVLELATSSDGSTRGSLGNITGSLPLQNFGYLVVNRAGSGDNYDINNNIVGSGILRKLNSGTLTLRGGNSNYTGTTQVLGGRLSVASVNGLGSTAGLTTVSTGGTLELRSITSPETVVLNGGTLASAASASGLSGTLILTKNSTVNSPNNNAEFTLSGPILAYPGTKLTTTGNQGRITLTGSSNQISNIALGLGSSLQIGNGSTSGSTGRGTLIETLAGSTVITNTVNSQMVFNSKITGSGRYVHARNSVFLTADNDYTGETIIGGNGIIGVLNQSADLRVGADTYTGSLGTGKIIIQASPLASMGSSLLRYVLNRSTILNNAMDLNPANEGANVRQAHFVRYGLGSVTLAGTITAGTHDSGADLQRGILQSDGGGKLVISGTINNGINNRLDIVNNGFIVFDGNNSAANQDLWGVLSGNNPYTFRNPGTITLKGLNTFNSANYVRRGTVVVDNADGTGLQDDTDFYVTGDSQLHFNYSETVGSVLTHRGSTLQINSGATLTLDDAITTGNFGRITGGGSLTLSANGAAAWYGLFGPNDLPGDALIGSSGFQTTVRVNSLPDSGQVSSLGTGSTIVLGVAGGIGETRFEYTGAGEATNRAISLNSAASTIRIAGSGRNGLILNGDMTVTDPGNKTLHLHGQTSGNTINGMINQSTSVLSLVVNTPASGNDMYGAGRWVLTNGGNNFSGPVVVNMGVLELVGDLGNGTGTSSVFGNLATTRQVDLGTANFDGRRFDVFGGADNLGAVGGLATTGTLLFNDPSPGTASFGANLTFTQSFSNTTNPGNGEIINNGNKVLEFAGAFTAGSSGNRNWILDGSNPGANTIKGVISDTSTTGANTVGVLKEGAGRWKLTGANTYEGSTTIARGILEISGGLAVHDNGTINLSNAGSDGIATEGSIFRVLQSETVGGFLGVVGSTVDIAEGQLLTSRAAAQTFNGMVTGGGGLVRTNNDTNARDMTLTNLNSYTGPTRITTNNVNFVSNRINVLFLANGGENSGIGAASNAASNLVLDNGTGGGGLRWAGVGNQSTDRLFTLGAGAGAGALWADGLVVGDVAPTIRFSNPGAIGFLTSNTNQTLTLRGGTISDNRFDPLISNNGTGITSLTKADAGMWILTNANTYSGATTISGGTLAITHGGALGTSAVNVTGGGGTGLQLRGGITVGNAITNSTSDGGVASATGSNILSGTITLAGSNAQWRLGVSEGSTLNITGPINGTVGSNRVVIYDRGTLILSGTNGYTGITSIAGGTTVLNYDTAAGGSNTSKLANGSPLELGFSGAGSGITTGLGSDVDVPNQSYQAPFAGATIVLSGGDHLEVVSATTLNNGANKVIRTSGTAKLQMGAITRSVGGNVNEYGTIDFGAPSIATTSTLNSTGGILGGAVAAYATVDRTNWAVTAASGSNIDITALASYSANNFAANANTDITAATVNAASGATTHTIRFNTNNGGTTNLTLAGILNLETGGILVTKNVTDDIVISGGAGSLRRSATTGNIDTVIHHFGTGLMSLNVPLVNNSAGQALTKTGTGTLALNAANTYTGRLSIQQGMVVVGDGTAATSTARLGNGNNGISMADGTTLRINVANPSMEFTPGVINGGGLLHLAPTNTSIFTLINANDNWLGDILVQGGTLRVRAQNNAMGSLRGITTIDNGGRLDINGSGQTFSERLTLLQGALVTVTNNGATNSSATLAGTLTLQNTTAAGATFDVGASQSLNITAIIRSTKGFTKTGNGILTISANQMQDLLAGASAGSNVPNANAALKGQVIISAGDVRLANARALGATGVNNETIVLPGGTLDLRGQSLNYFDDPDPSREIIRIKGVGNNGLGALKNTSGLGIVSHIAFDGDATISGGGYLNGSRLVLAGYDTNPNSSSVAAGSLLEGNYTRVQGVIDGNNANLTIFGAATANDVNGTGVTWRDPSFASALNSITLKEGVFRIEKELGIAGPFQGLKASNITNGITIAYGGPSLADQTNASLGMGANMGARLNFYRNLDTVHTVKIIMDGVTAKNNQGANYIDLGMDTAVVIPNPRTYLNGEITLLGDSNRNIFHIDASSNQLSIGEQGNLTGIIQAKLVVGGQMVGSGGFTKTGLRELRLTNNNTFTGAVNVLRFGTAAMAWQDNTMNVNGINYQTYGDAESWAEWGLTLSGANGALSGTQSVNLQRRGLITLDNTQRLNQTNLLAGATGGNNNDRINNAADINFNHGWMKIIGGASNNSEALATENNAKLNVLSGTNIIDMMPTVDGTSMTLTIGEIVRSPGSVLLFNNLDSTSKFSTASGADSVRVILNNIGTLQQSGSGTQNGAANRKIVVGLMGGITPHEYLSDLRELGFNNGNASDYLNQGRNLQFITSTHFMTYDGNVLRPLDDSEYFVPLDGLLDNVNGSAGKNVNLNEAFTIARQDMAINALRFGPLADNNGDGLTGTPIHSKTTLTSMTDPHNVQLYVDGTLAIDSGMISSAYFATGNTGNTASPQTFIMGGTLNFGNREAIISNQNAIVRGLDGVVATGNLEIRSSIAGNAGLLKTGIAQVVLDGRNTYKGVTTISNGTLFLRNGRSALGVGGEGNGVVIEGNGSLNSGNGIRVGSPDAYENILVKALQASLYVMRTDNDLTNWYSNLVIDNVDAAGHPLHTPMVRTDNSATAIINGNIYGGATAVSNDILAIDPRIVQFESGGSNTFIFRGQFGDRGDATGKALAIANPISTLPSLAGVRTNENEVLRVNFNGAGGDTNFVMEKQYNAAGRLTMNQGNLLITYDPNDPTLDGNGFWTNEAISKIPNADSNSTTFATNGGTSFQGIIFGSNNGTGSIFLTKPGQVFNMAAWTATGTGPKWLGGTNETGEVRYGSSTATNNLSIGGTTLRLYSMAGGSVVFDHRITGNPGTAPNNIGFTKTGRGNITLRNSTNTTAGDSNFEIAGGKLILDHSGQNVALVGGGNAILSGGVVQAQSNLSANTTVGYAITNGANSVLQLRLGTSEIIAEGRGTGLMTVNLGNANANNNRANLTRAAGAAVNFVETTTSASAVPLNAITLNFNNFSNSVLKNRIISWATYSNTPREALDFAMADAGAANRVKPINRVAGEYLNDASTWANWMDVSENGGAGFFGTVTTNKILNTLRFDTMADSLVTIGAAQTLTLGGDGIAGALLVSSNTGAANKTIAGGSIEAFTTSYTGGTTVNSNVITGVSSTANLQVGMPITGSGIPAGAYITAINGNSLTISANATVTAAGMPLKTSTPEIIIHQYGKGTLTIDSTIKGETGLTIAGPSTTAVENFGSTGVVKLTGGNTYTGQTYINGAVLQIAEASALGPNPTDVKNGHLALNGGTLRWTGGTASLGNRGVLLHGDGGVFDVVNASSNLIIGSALSGTQASLASQEIFRGDLVKMGAGALTLLGVHPNFQGLMDVRQGSLIVMADNGNAGAGTIAVLGSNRSWADGTILRQGTNLQLFLGNGNNSGDWTIDEFFTFEGNNTVTYGGLLDVTASLAGDVLSGGQYNLGSRRPLNLHGIIDIKGTTTFDVINSGVLRFNNGAGYITGSGDIVKDGAGRLEFRANTPDWTGNLVIKQGTVWASNQADAIGTGYNSGKKIILGDSERTGVAEFMVNNPDSVHAWMYDINHDIDVVYNPAQTKRIGADSLSNGNYVAYNGNITLNDNLVLSVRDTGVPVGGEQYYVQFNGKFRDGTVTSGNILVQSDDGDGTLNNSITNRSVGYAVFNGDNSGWTGDVTISNNAVYNQDNTSVLRMGHQKALTAANDVTMNFNSILQAGGQTVTIGNLSTQGGTGAFYGDAGTMGSTGTSTVPSSSTEIIENASSTPGVLTITQSTPASYEASWDAFFRDGTLNSQFFAPGANVLQPSASLGIVKAGNGWATLTLDNDYTGPTVVQAGVLQVGRNGIGDTGKPAGGVMTTVQSGGILAGSGLIQGQLTVLAGGTLRTGDLAGHSIGTLAVSGDAIFASGSQTLMQVRNPTYNNPGALIATDQNYNSWKNNILNDSFKAGLDDLVTTNQHDMVNATGTIRWSPGTKITLQNDGYTPRAGDIFRLFKGAGYLGNINVGANFRPGGESNALLDLILFALGGNLLWDVSLFNSTGILMVVESDASVQTIAAPTITQQPTSNPANTVLLDPGTSVTLTTAAISDGLPANLKYQWLLNGLPVEGAAAKLASYTFVANFNTKGVYTVAVTNEGGTVLSTGSITIGVDDLPDITFAPSPVTKLPGSSHTFNISVGGQSPFTFQWYKDGEPISGATNQNLLLTNIQETDEGSYYVVATNAAGTDTSDAAFLDVVDPVSAVVATVNPTETYLGQDLVFSVTNAGEGNVTYQWRKDNQPINEPTATTASYKITKATSAAEGSYTVTVGNDVNSVTSNAIVIDLQDPMPVITAAPQSKTILSGEPLELKVVAKGRPALRYAWKKNNAVLANTTTADISKTAAAVTDGGTYVVEVSNVAGKTSNASAPAEIVVVDSGSRYLPVAPAATATLNAVVGVGPKTVVTYKWKRIRIRQVMVDPGPDMEAGTADDITEPEEYDEAIQPDPRITGVNTKSMKITKVTEADNGLYRVEVVGPAGGSAVTGSTYDLRVFTAAPQLTANPFTYDNALIGRDYSFQVPVDRSDISRTPDKITAAGLPPGLKIDPISGLITGKPTATKAGGYKVVLTVANKMGKVTATGILDVLTLNNTIPGVWVGLVNRNANLGDGLGGRVDLTVTSKATYTGKLVLAGTTYNFGGPLDVNGASPTGTAFIKRAGNPLPEPLRLDFVLNPINNTITSGTITDGTSSVSFTGWRQIFSKTVPANTYTGYYTLAIGLSDDSPLNRPEGSATVPLGAGYATFTVAPDGKLTVAGKMPDGEALSSAGFVGPDGQVAVYQYMYKALKPGGSLIGQLAIDDKDDADLLNSNNSLGGSLSWVRPASTKTTDRTFKAGFGVPGAPVSTPLVVVASGGRYDPPAVGKVVLNLTEPTVPVNNAEIDFFNGGDLDYTYTAIGGTFTSMNPDVDVAVIKGSKVTILKENVAANVTKTAMTAVPKTGLLSGSFTSKDWNPRNPMAPQFVTRVVKFYGVIVREETESGSQLVGVGYFLLPQLPVPPTTNVPGSGTTDKTSPYYSGRFVFEKLP